MSSRTSPIALVTGFTIHGLAVARALSRAGVEVHALTPPGSRHSPARYTRYARVHVRDNLNSDALLGHLLEFAGNVPADRQIVLFPTSDRMAATMARNWPELQDRFLLSWAHCRDLVLQMQLKDNLPAMAERTGVLHPRSLRISVGSGLCLAQPGKLRLPCIVKPVRPLSAFKALVVAHGGGTGEPHGNLRGRPAIHRPGIHRRRRGKPVRLHDVPRSRTRTLHADQPEARRLSAGTRSGHHLYDGGESGGRSGHPPVSCWPRSERAGGPGIQE